VIRNGQFWLTGEKTLTVDATWPNGVLLFLPPAAQLLVIGNSTALDAPTLPGCSMMNQTAST
jgi:predicted oxidoreductase